MIVSDGKSIGLWPRAGGGTDEWVEGSTVYSSPSPHVPHTPTTHAVGVSRSLNPNEGGLTSCRVLLNHRSM